MKKRVIIVFGFLLLGIALFVVTVVQTGVDTIIGTLRDFSLWHFGIFLGVSVIYYLLYAVRWYMIIRTLHHDKV